MPRSLMIRLHCVNSALRKVRACSGEPVTISVPSLAKRSASSGDVIVSVTAWLIFITMSRGVPAGASSMNQLVKS
jgi:hypothetical protein